MDKGDKQELDSGITEALWKRSLQLLAVQTLTSAGELGCRARL